MLLFFFDSLSSDEKWLLHDYALNEQRESDRREKEYNENLQRLIAENGGVETPQMRCDAYWKGVVLPPGTFTRYYEEPLDVLSGPLEGMPPKDPVEAILERAEEYCKRRESHT